MSAERGARQDGCLPRRPQTIGVRAGTPKVMVCVVEGAERGVETAYPRLLEKMGGKEDRRGPG